jgi:hypothetical protein
MNTIPSLCLALGVAVLSSLTINTSHAATPEKKDNLRIQTGIPKKSGDALFSYTTEWRKDQAEKFRVTSLSFLNIGKLGDKNQAAQVGKKLVTAFKDSMIQLDPNARGAIVTQTDDMPGIVISNHAGYSLTAITVRDYSNQPIRYDLIDKSFSEYGVEIAIDLVMAADVEYLEEFVTRKQTTASQGEIVIGIDQQPPVHIKTDGKTTRQLEEEIARNLAVPFSETPLLPALVSTDKRNIKPFDEGEVQLPKLAAHAISIAVSDPELGVITKFKYPDDNQSDLQILEPPSVLAFMFALVLGTLGYFMYKKHKS